MAFVLHMTTKLRPPGVEEMVLTLTMDQILGVLEIKVIINKNIVQALKTPHG